MSDSLINLWYFLLFQRFTPTQLLQALRNKRYRLGMVVDLTNTYRYYNGRRVSNLSCKLHSIKVLGSQNLPWEKRNWHHKGWIPCIESPHCLPLFVKLTCSGNYCTDALKTCLSSLVHIKQCLFACNELRANILWSPLPDLMADRRGMMPLRRIWISLPLQHVFCTSSYWPVVFTKVFIAREQKVRNKK